MKYAAIGLLILTISFMIAYAVSDNVISAIVTGTGTGDTLIQSLWQLVLAGVGMVLLVTTGFKDI